MMYQVECCATIDEGTRVIINFNGSSEFTGVWVGDAKLLRECLYASSHNNPVSTPMPPECFGNCDCCYPDRIKTCLHANYCKVLYRRVDELLIQQSKHDHYYAEQIRKDEADKVLIKFISLKNEMNEKPWSDSYKWEKFCQKVESLQHGDQK